MFESALVQPGNRLRYPGDVGYVIAKSDDIIAGNGNAPGVRDDCWRGWTRAGSGTRCLLAGGEGKRRHRE